jgi:hypothetical protein
MERLAPLAKDRTLEVLKAEVPHCPGSVTPSLKNILNLRHLRWEDSVIHPF